jgi:futalosine hydrolase
VERRLDAVLGGGTCLVVVATAREALAVLTGAGRPGDRPPGPWTARRLNDRIALLVTGVGQANGAGATVLADPGGFAGVLSMGIAGALPGPRQPEVGRVVLCDSCALADSGLQTAEGFTTQTGMGFPAVEGFGESFPSDPAWVAALRPLADAVGSCATVSTCSGTDALAEAIAARAGALCEDMESAAVALAAARLGTPFAALRVISNRTGERSRQGWDMARAFSVLADLAGSI